MYEFLTSQLAEEVVPSASQVSNKMTFGYLESALCGMDLVTEIDLL